MSATLPCSPNTRRNQENLSPKQNRPGHEDRSAIAGTAATPSEPQTAFRAHSGRRPHRSCCSVISPSLTASPVPALANRTSILALFPALGLFRSRRSRSSRLAASPRTPVTFRPISLTASSSASLPPARDENIGTFFNEPLGARQRHATRSTRDDCNPTLELSHDFSFQAPSLVDWGRPREFRHGSAGVRR